MYEKRKNDGKFNERDFGARIQNNVRGTRVRKSGKRTQAEEREYTGALR